MLKLVGLNAPFPRSSGSKLSSKWLNTSAMSEKSRWHLSSTPTICANGYVCISKNFRVLSPGNAITPEQREIQQIKAQIKRLEMEKEILKQVAVLMSEIPGKLSH